jgi:hypothetical protein
MYPLMNHVPANYFFWFSYPQSMAEAGVRSI